MHIAFLSIGSNIGNRLENMKCVLKYLNHDKSIDVLKISSVYETEPKYNKDQEFFYNAVFKIKTKYTPYNLLRKCKKIERHMGRLNKGHNLPRIIDIDIVSYDNLEINSKELIIPHSKMEERNFVLFPLFDVSNNYIHPKNNKSIIDLLKANNDTSKIIKLSYILT